MDKKIGIAVLGAGSRSFTVVGELLKAAGDGVRVVSLYEPDRQVAEKSLAGWRLDGVRLGDSAGEAINAPGVDWVMVFSPNCCHCEQTLAAFAAGKNVFSEKPLATSAADCRRIYDAHLASGKIFATGFVLRYAPLYRRAYGILKSGVLGRIYAVDADEHIRPEHGGYIMRNWRRHTAEAGPHILEKCCHDLDLLLWLCGSRPARVTAMGRRSFFLPENDGLMNKYGRETFCSWPDPHAVPTPFNDDTDLMDTLGAVLEMRNGILVTFSATMSNTAPERRMYFHCTEGNLTLELYSGRISWRKLGSDESTEVIIRGDGHGGGDSLIMQELWETMTAGTPPKCSGSEGLESAVTALAVDEAARTGKVVDLEPVWRSLGR